MTLEQAMAARERRYQQRMAEMASCTQEERQEEWERMERDDAAEMDALVDEAIKATFPQS